MAHFTDDRGGFNRRRAEENEMLRSELRLGFELIWTVGSLTPLPLAAAADGREVLNEHAVKVIKRIEDKLTGTDFKAGQVLKTPEQVARLIEQAQSLENLCQCFIGWCACESPSADPALHSSSLSITDASCPPQSGNPELPFFSVCLVRIRLLRFWPRSSVVRYLLFSILFPLFFFFAINLCSASLKCSATASRPAS